MALPNIMRRLFRNDGYGPLLKPEIIPFASDLASNAADVAPSTEWVKDLAVAPVYLDPAGNDANDGMSAATAVKSFSRAAEIAKSLPLGSGGVKVVLKGGTYTMNVYVSGFNCVFDLQGNATIIGNVSIGNSGYAFFSGQYSLDIEGGIESFDASVIIFDVASLNHTGYSHVISNSSFFALNNCSYTLTYSYTGNTKVPFLLSRSSVCSLKSFTLHVSNISQEFAPGFDSVIFCSSSFFQATSTTIDANNVSVLSIQSQHGADIDIDSLSISGSNFMGIACFDASNIFLRDVSIANSLAAGNAISCGSSGNIVIFGQLTCYSASNSSTISIYDDAKITFFSDVTITNKASNINIIQCYNSSFMVFRSGGTLKISSSTTASRFIYVDNNGTVTIDKNINFSGSVSSATVSVSGSGYLYLNPNASVSGSVTGDRYWASRGGQICVDGAGENRIPGSNPGGVWDGSYGFYG